MLKIFNLDQARQWDAVVRSFAHYDVYWLSGYVKAFQIHGDGEPYLFYYEDNETRGINVVMKRDIAYDEHFKGQLEANKYFDFSTPYGYGGWIIEGRACSKIFDNYGTWCKKNDIICEFVRFHPLLKNHKFSAGSYDVIPHGKTVAMDLSSPEIIWSNVTSKNRNAIRKAQKHGIKIYNGRYPEIYRIFRDIYIGTMDKDDAEEYYYFEPKFFDSICNELSQNAQIFYAVLDEEVIAASIMLTSNGRMNYHLSGSIREYSSLAPTNLLLYEAALWGCANGCRTLYLGGGVGSGEDGLFKFKKSFYRLDDLPRFYTGRRIFNMEAYKYLTLLRGNIQSEDFFPIYRAMM